MEKYIGIWLDHRKAIIVSVVGENASQSTIHSGAQMRRRIRGEGKQYTRMSNAYLSPEQRHAERVKHQLARYYDQICTSVEDATDILIFGPGEAKIELEHVLHLHKSLAEKIRKVEAADSLTDNQIVAHVREFAARMIAFKHPLNHPFAV